MKEALSIVIPGEPVAWSRARLAGKTFFTAKKLRTAKTAAAMQGKIEMKGGAPFIGPVSVRIYARFSIPKSWPRWKQQAARDGDIHHTSKPDGDNLAKMIGDALNGIVWKDDAQIYSCTVEKGYADEAHTLVLIDVPETQMVRAA